MSGKTFFAAVMVCILALVLGSCGPALAQRSCSVPPTIDDILKMPPQEKEEALNKMERNAEALPEPFRRDRLRSLARARALACVNIGINGEIIVLTNTPPTAEYYYSLVRNRDGSASITKDPLDQSSAFASISKQGDVKIVGATKATVRRQSGPSRIVRGA